MRGFLNRPLRMGEETYKWKCCDVEWTDRFVDGGWYEEHAAIRLDNNIRFD